MTWVVCFLLGSSFGITALHGPAPLAFRFEEASFFWRICISFFHSLCIYIYNLWFVLSYVRSCEAMGSSDSDSESSSKELVEVEEERPAGTAAGVLEPEPEDPENQKTSN